MVAFNDRRKASYGSVDEVASRLSLHEGDTVGKHLINDAFLVRGTKNEEGKREFVIHEALPNGQVIERGRSDRRYRAKTDASGLKPTSVYDI